MDYLLKNVYYGFVLQNKQFLSQILCVTEIGKIDPNRTDTIDNM